MSSRRRSWPARIGRTVFLLALLAFFVLPQLAMVRFSFQKIPVILLGWDNLTEGWSLDSLRLALERPEFWEAAKISGYISVMTTVLVLALLIPVAVLVEIQAPRLKPWITAATLIPWVVPPIALVVGVAGTFRTLMPWFLASPWSMVPFYALWAMPFTYRALDAGLRAINARTLYEASVSLGASAPTVLGKVILPNMIAAIIASAGLTISMVLGEFAFASLLLKQTLPVYLANTQTTDARGGMALALVVMVLTSLALVVVVRLLQRRGVEFTAAGVG